jgi:hypothetical protein
VPNLDILPVTSITANISAVRSYISNPSKLWMRDQVNGKTIMTTTNVLATSLGVGMDINVDGITDQFSVFKSLVEAAPSGSTLIVPSGTIRLASNLSADYITIPQNVTLKSQGRTKILINGAATALTFFRPNANVTFEGFDFYSLGLNSSYNYNIIQWAYDNLTIKNCTFNGNCFTTSVLGSGSSNTFGKGILVGTNNATGLFVDSCKFFNLDYGIQKQNFNTNIHSNIRISNSEFYNNFSNDISLAGEVGVIKDVFIHSTLHRDSKSWERNANGIGIFCATVKGLTISSCIGENRVASDFIRLEEGCTSVSIVGCESNQIGGSGIVVADANVSGTRAGNFGGSIVSNNIYRLDHGTSSWNNSTSYLAGQTVYASGSRFYCTTNNTNKVPSDKGYWFPLAAADWGIQLVYGGAVPQPVNRWIVADNTIYGFDLTNSVGLEVGSNAGVVNTTQGQSVIVHDNIIENCAVGMFVLETGTGIHDNYSKNCFTGLKGRRCHIKSHIFQDCTVNIDADDSGRPLVIDEMRMSFTKVNISAGWISWPILQKSSLTRINTDAVVDVSTDGTGSGFASRRSTITFDGTTLVDTQLLSVNSGTWTGLTFSGSASDIQFAFNTPSSAAGIITSMTLRGLIHVGVT